MCDYYSLSYERTMDFYLKRLSDKESFENIECKNYNISTKLLYIKKRKDDVYIRVLTD